MERLPAKYDPPAQFAELDAYRDASYPFRQPISTRAATTDRVFENSAPISLGDDYNATFTITGPGSSASLLL